ncbi:hypothetical protein [Ideonella sp.]|uniref:hypothetical protein n=1 Tax=Ideonella sp. TaxID=1929293 RepID=UPI0035AF2EF6
MNTTPNGSPACVDHLLRFRSLFDEGRGFAFPCDAQGHVDLAALSPRALNNYLFAHTLIGRDFSTPAIETVVH